MEATMTMEATKVNTEEAPMVIDVTGLPLDKIKTQIRKARPGTKIVAFFAREVLQLADLVPSYMSFGFSPPRLGN